MQNIQQKLIRDDAGPRRLIEAWSPGTASALREAVQGLGETAERSRGTATGHAIAWNSPFLVYGALLFAVTVGALTSLRGDVRASAHFTGYSGNDSPQRTDPVFKVPNAGGMAVMIPRYPDR
jgi:hypothetical protein